MINLHYIRAAIEQATGIRLTLDRVRVLLVEEGIVTQRRADRDSRVITSYASYFGSEASDTFVEDVIDTEMGLPE